MKSAPLLMLSLALIFVGLACLIEELGLSSKCDVGNGVGNGVGNDDDDDDDDDAGR